MVYLNDPAQLWDINDVEYEEMTVPEWKVNGEPLTIRIKSLSGAERDKYEQSLSEMRNGVVVPNIINARARLVAMSIVDEAGRRVFPDTLVLKLGTKSSKALDRVFEKAAQLAGITPQDMEQMTEGFTEGQSDSSTSD